MQDERREGSRSSVLKRVKITFGNPDLTHSVIDCVVTNTSPSGIRVRTTITANIPEWVTLVFPDGVAVRARRRWAQGTEIGLELVAKDGGNLLGAMISGLTPDQRRALIAQIEASLVPKSE
ncbi:MAG: hypothetical protein ACREFY_19815 [Acetobacteraceae bacterium]